DRKNGSFTINNVSLRFADVVIFIANADKVQPPQVEYGTRRLAALGKRYMFVLNNVDTRLNTMVAREDASGNCWVEERKRDGKTGEFVRDRNGQLSSNPRDYDDPKALVIIPLANCFGTVSVPKNDVEAKKILNEDFSWDYVPFRRETDRMLALIARELFP